MKLIFILIIGYLIFNWVGDYQETNAESRRDAGASDGYAVGYNTTCKIRATLIEGDWKDPDYTSGYYDGYADGAEDCRADRNK